MISVLALMIERVASVVISSCPILFYYTLLKCWWGSKTWSMVNFLEQHVFNADPIEDSFVLMPLGYTNDIFLTGIYLRLLRNEHPIRVL